MSNIQLTYFFDVMYIKYAYRTGRTGVGRVVGGVTIYTRTYLSTMRICSYLEKFLATPLLLNRSYVFLEIGTWFRNEKLHLGTFYF